MCTAALPAHFDNVPEMPQCDSPPIPGFVYVVQMEGHPLYKIGRSIDIPRRMSEFGVLLPFPFDLLFARRVPDARWGEYLLHHEFRKSRTNGEWFRLNLSDIETAKAQLLYLQSTWLIQRVVQKLYNETSLEGRSGAPYLRRYARLIYRLNARDDRRLSTLAERGSQPGELGIITTEAVS